MNTEHKIATNANMIKSTRHWVTFNCFFEVNSLEVVEVVPEVTLLASEGFTLIALEDPFNLAIFSIGMVASSASSELLAASDDPDTNPFGGCGLGEAIVRGCQLACLFCRSIQSQKNPSKVQGFPLINYIFRIFQRHSQIKWGNAYVSSTRDCTFFGYDILFFRDFMSQTMRRDLNTLQIRIVTVQQVQKLSQKKTLLRENIS